jgi:hypothetical protein
MSIQQSAMALVDGGHNPDLCHHRDYVKHEACPAKLPSLMSLACPAPIATPGELSDHKPHVEGDQWRLSRSQAPRARRGLCGSEVTSWPSPRRARQCA